MSQVGIGDLISYRS